MQTVTAAAVATEGHFPIEVDTGPWTEVEVNLAPPHLLIVDDDEVVLQRLECIASLDGYTVYTATGGEEALELLREQPISLVLADVVMPGMSGKSLCQALRGLPMPSYVYTIMLSASDGADDIVSALDAGADDFVSKSASSAELLARLRAGRRVAGLDMALRREVAETDRRCHVDRLTQCFNLQHLVPELQREVDRSRQHQHDLSVLMCNVEHFRDINSVHSPSVGDEVLQQIAARLRTGTRDESAWVARYHDDQFAIVMPETPLERAFDAAEQLAASLLQDPVHCSAGLFPLTLRVGVVGARPYRGRRPPTATALLRAADACLGVSRTLGNRLVTARPFRAELGRVHDARAGQPDGES